VSAAAALRSDPAPGTLPRLLAGIHAGRPVTLGEHLGRHGPLARISPRDTAWLFGLVEASGLRGRGGSSFPTATKLRAVAAQRGRPVVVVNGTEGEPVSGKDRVLLRHAPHLVLDGAVTAATVLGARKVVVAVSEGAREELTVLGEAIASRVRASTDGRVACELAAVPPGFVSGEETALVRFLNGGPALPTTKPPLPFERGVGGAPTLVQNTETLAHLALIVRAGADWFRAVGTPAEPGSMLVTISGAVHRPGVHELAFGTPLSELVSRAGGFSEPPRAVLVGGYFGTWVSAADAELLRLSDADLGRRGAALGAGAIAVLPASACGVVETARVVGYLAGESAGQCGPCVHGLAAISDSLAGLAGLAGRERAGDGRVLVRRLAQVTGRGACRHPDGVARLVHSTLAVFADEVKRHAAGRHCGGASRPVLPVPKRGRR
jgi:NADH:ubiquinone oxidoreductase subunit F (NADH-binding)